MLQGRTGIVVQKGMGFFCKIKKTYVLGEI